MSSLSWLTSDLANILKGIEVLAPRMGADLVPPEQAAFQAGFYTALTTVAVSLGITPTERMDVPERMNVRIVRDDRSLLR